MQDNCRGEENGHADPVNASGLWVGVKEDFAGMCVFLCACLCLCVYVRVCTCAYFQFDLN